MIVLAEVTPPVRIDQAGIVALASTAPPVRVAAGGMVALVAITPNVPVAQAGIIALAYGSPCGTRWAQIWTITRPDGLVFRFTSLDRDLEYPPGSGITYQACDSLVPSSSENVSQVDQAGSMDLSGALGTITEHELYSGLFDGAKVEAWLIAWAGEGLPKRLLKGTFGAAEQSQISFKTELLGDGEKLQQTPLVQTLKPGCRWDFGDVNCGKALGPLTVTGTVDSASGQRGFVDAARAEPAGYFTRGKVTFTSGDNAGRSAEIKEHSAGGVFVLWPRIAFPILAGVSYSMTPGCTLLKAADGGTNGCTAWGRLATYGGFDKVPGGDKRSAAANVKPPG